MGGWNGDQVPWMKFLSFLLASSAGDLKNTVILACKVCQNDQQESDLAFMRTMFDFICTNDGQVLKHHVLGIQEAINTNAGSVKLNLEHI